MISVVVVDDKEKHRKANIDVINSLKDFKNIESFDDGYKLIDYCYKCKSLPDIILMDIEMKKMDGVTASDYVNEYFPGIKIIAVSSHGEEPVIQDMLSCGCMGYVFRHDFFGRQKSFAIILKTALQKVALGKVYVDERVFYRGPSRSSLMQKRKAEKKLSERFDFSKIEKEIIALNGGNLSYKEMGTILSQSPRTLENKVNDLTKRLDIPDGKEGLKMFSLRNLLIKLARFTQTPKD